jgi:hypothetical protein
VVLPLWKGGGGSLGELQSQSGHTGEEKSFLDLPGTEARSLVFLNKILKT